MLQNDESVINQLINQSINQSISQSINQYYTYASILYQKTNSALQGKQRNLNSIRQQMTSDERNDSAYLSVLMHKMRI